MTAQMPTITDTIDPIFAHVLYLLRRAFESELVP